MHHPWSALAEHWPHVAVVWADLPAGMWALTDGRSTVWMHRRLLQRERRVAIAHEIIHLERADIHAVPAAVERQIDAETARRLIPIEQLIAALQWDQRLDVLAEELWVTPELVHTRIDTLTEDERALVIAALEA